MKRLCIYLIVALVAIATGACAGNEFQREIDNANSHCPQTVAPGIVMQSVSSHDGYIVYRYYVDESLVDLQALDYSIQSKEYLKAVVRQLKETEYGRHFISLAKERDLGMKTVFDGSRGAKLEAVIEASEL